MTEEVLVTIKSSLDDILAELNTLKISVCVALAYIEIELEKVKQ